MLVAKLRNPNRAELLVGKIKETQGIAVVLPLNEVWHHEVYRRIPVEHNLQLAFSSRNPMPVPCPVFCLRRHRKLAFPKGREKVGARDNAKILEVWIGKTVLGSVRTIVQEHRNRPVRKNVV